MSLRRRLVVGLVVLAGIGLLASDFATYTSLRSFLSSRVDDQLASSRNQAYNYLASNRFANATGLRQRVSSDIYVQYVDGSGNAISIPYPGSNNPQPILPQQLPVSLSGSLFSGGDPNAIPRGVSLQLGAVGRTGTQYRALVIPLPVGGAVVLSAPLEPMGQTLSKLITIEEIVSGIVLAALIALALWVVRLGLRPLDDMGRRGGKIARGDLSQRVEHTGQNTEVGRLGDALNSMLTQIEAAFRERAASEERLRRFVADASHELRTPLTSIRGYAELYRRGVSRDAEGIDRAMGRIEGEDGRMGCLVEGLLLVVPPE